MLHARGRLETHATFLVGKSLGKRLLWGPRAKEIIELKVPQTSGFDHLSRRSLKPGVIKVKILMVFKSNPV
jgi:hypothetical protein